MTLRRTLPIAGACAVLFGASFAAGDSLLDDDDSPRARPTRQEPPADSGQPAVRQQLALALGRAAGLPGLRTPPPPAKTRRAKTPSRRAGARPAQPAAAAPPASPTGPAPGPVPETQPVATPAPTPNSSPPTPPPPARSSPPSASAPGPDAAPKLPQPTPDPPPSGGASYEPEEK